MYVKVVCIVTEKNHAPHKRESDVDYATSLFIRSCAQLICKKRSTLQHLSQRQLMTRKKFYYRLKVNSVDGNYIKLRGLLDQVSQVSLITEDAAQRLRLLRRMESDHFPGIAKGR